MSKGFAVLLLAVAGFVGYLSYTGTTWRHARAWLDRQVGRAQPADLKSLPHTGYAPVVMPGR